MLALGTAHRLQRAITISAVNRWRMMLLTRLGRQVPNYDMKLMFSNHELLFLPSHAKQYRLGNLGNLGAGLPSHSAPASVATAPASTTPSPATKPSGTTTPGAPAPDSGTEPRSRPTGSM